MSSDNLDEDDLKWPDKDPNEKLDYQIDWSERLSDDTIATSTWIIPTGLVLEVSSNTDTTTVVWLSGGVLSKNYKITNRITTVAGRIMDQSVFLTIANR